MRATAVLFALAILATAMSGQAVYTLNTGSHDWNTAASYSGHTGTPCNGAGNWPTNAGDGTSTCGDYIVIPSGATLTCTGASEVCRAGNSGATVASCTSGVAAILDQSGAGGLTIGSTARAVYSDPVCLPFGTIALNAGAKINHDSSHASTPVAYQWADNNNSVHSLWAVGANLSSARSVIEGDSFYAPGVNLTKCPVANTAGCKAGAFNLFTSLAEGGEGTFYNLTIQNVLGTTRGSGVASWVANVISGTDGNYQGLLMSGSGYMDVHDQGTKTFTLNQSRITATTNALNNTGGISFNGTGAGGYVVTNDVFEVNVVTQAAQANETFRNVICNAPPAGINYTPGASNVRPCFQVADSSQYDQVFWYLDGWNTTTTENTNVKSAAPSSYLVNSIIVQPRNMNAQHIHALNQSYPSVVGGSWLQVNNFIATFGDTKTPSTEQDQAANASGGNPTTATTILVSGNISGCGYQGRASFEGNGLYYSVTTSSNIAADAISVFNNDYCSSAPSLASGNQTSASAALEAGTFPADMINAEANVFFRADYLSGAGFGAGAVPEIYSTTANSGYVSTPPFHRLRHNAVLNTSTTVAPCGSTGSNCSWVHSGFAPSSATDIIKTSQAVGKVDPGRSWPLFSEYLNNSGLFPYASYGASAWVSGHSYSVGDVVFVDSTVTGYSNVYGGRKTFWKCTEGHLSGATNQPIIAVDASNPFQTDRFWQDAYISLWLKPAILAGTTYTDGALPPLYNSSTMYAVGLVNAWLRQGFVNVDSSLWGGVAGAPGCSIDSGATWTECGAVPLATIRHIPAPPVIN